MSQRPTPPSPAVGLIEMLTEDISAIMRNDPAARSMLEVVLTYPGLHAIWIHRLAHELWLRGQTTQARILSHMGRSMTGIEIHPGAVLGRRVFIDHGMGVVIGETAIVGDDCLIYKGVVLGGTSLERSKRHPTLGQGVVVGSNACILGNVSIGDRAKIGSGSVVIRNVPAGSTAVGVPGRIVSTTDSQLPLDHASLPDPVATVIRTLTNQVEALARRIEELEEGPATSPGPPRRRAYREHQGEDHPNLAAVFFEDFED